MQCQELCDAIIDVLKHGKILRTGMSFAILVDEVLELGVVANTLLGAAIEGLPLDPTEREELEILLDYGGDKMLDALAKCDNLLGRTTDYSMGGNDGENDAILNTLGEHLAEMKRHDRAKMLPSLFARCLLKFPPCTLPEANYATMIFDYINDREESGHELSESCVMAFLGTIDFVSISRGALLNNFIPRAEKLLSPSYALVLNDFTGFNFSPLITRCTYSMQMLGQSKGLRRYAKVAVLSCGNIVSEDSVESMLINFKNMDNCSEGMKIKVLCPFCKSQRRDDEGDGRVHYLGVQRKRDWRHYDYNEYYTRNIEDKVELEFSENVTVRSFFDRKQTKIAALTHWITSQGDSEDENATSETTQKRSRSDNPGLLQSKGLFVRVLNQCSEMQSEKIFFHIIGSPDWRVKRTIEAFAKSLTAIRADKISHPSQGIGFFRYEPNGYSLGERLEPDSKWDEIGFNLQGDDEELIVARHLQTAGKPVIRIYSDVAIKNMEVSVDLEDMFDALTYPLALVEEKDVKNTSLSWTVDVHPRETTGDHSSIIQHKHDKSPLREYSYLFWEASAKKEFRINMTNASCVRSADLSTGLLQDALLAQGLSTDEATEMATHWLPALTKKTFALIEFLPTKELDKMAKLRVYPVPSRIHRVFMLFMSTDTDHSCNTPLVRSPAMVLSREGCSVVEWGGMECF